MTIPELPERPDRYDYLPRPYDHTIAASVTDFRLHIAEKTVRITHLEGLLDANKWGRAAELSAWIDLDRESASGDPDALTMTEFLALKIPGLSSGRTVLGIIRCWRLIAGQPRPHKGAKVRLPNRKFPTTAEIDQLRTPREVIQETIDAVAGSLDAAAEDRKDTVTPDAYNADRIRDVMIKPLDQVGAISDQLVADVAALDFREPYDNASSVKHAAGPLVWPIYKFQADAVLQALAEAAEKWEAAKAAVGELFSRAGFVEVVDGTVTAGDLEAMRKELESSRDPDGSRRIPNRPPGSTGAKQGIRDLLALGKGPWTTRELADLLRISRQAAHAACEALVREGVMSCEFRERRSGGNLYGRRDGV